MPDWFLEAIGRGVPYTNGQTDPIFTWPVFLTQIVLSMVFGFVVAGIYAGTLGRGRNDVRILATTLVLLTVLVAVVTLVIGDKLARAFGLVGALSIVRFRTIVEDTRDTAFVIFAVTVGMAVGAQHAMLALMAMPAVCIVALVMSLFDQPVTGTMVAVTLRLALGIDPEEALAPILNKYLDERRLKSTGTAKQGASLEVSYVGRLRSLTTAVAFVTELNKIEGVQSVELRQS